MSLIANLFHTLAIRPNSGHIVHITDTYDDDAREKIKSAYVKHKASFGPAFADVDLAPIDNTLSIGIKLSELVNNTERPERLLLALNCAPAEKQDGTKDNARSDFYFADLGDGITTGGTLNGFELSYVKPLVKSLYRLTTTNKLRSQFRSLQILPEHLLRFTNRTHRAKLIKSGELIEQTNLDIIPEIPQIPHVLQVDNFKNVKLYIPESTKLQPQTTISFAFGDGSVEYGATPPTIGQCYNALVTNALFDPPLNANVLTLNSSSTLLGGRPVPMIGTIRKRPAETNPAYAIPQRGQPVHIETLKFAS